MPHDKQVAILIAFVKYPFAYFVEIWRNEEKRLIYRCLY